MQTKQLFHFLLVGSLSLFLLTGCPGLSDYDIDLPGGYSVFSTSAHQVPIALEVSEGSWDAPVIPTKVTEVAWDDHYILAKQLDLKEDDTSHNGYQIPDETKVNYWILEVATGEVTGPLDEESYIKKKVELGISTDVVLRKIEDLSNN